MVVGVPWRVSDDDDKVDGEPYDVIKAERMTDDHVAREAEREQAVPNRFIISREDVDVHGYSARCSGCKSILRGAARQPHSEECRARLAKAMHESNKVRKAAAKMEEFVEKAVEREDLQRRKRARGGTPGDDDNGATSHTDPSIPTHTPTPPSPTQAPTSPIPTHTPTPPIPTHIQNQS
jgi:hypothetical protein